MSLVDPVSKSPLSIFALSRMRWIAIPLSWPLISKARRAARRADWAKASTAYSKALRLIPLSGSIWVQLGHSYGHLGQNDAMHLAYFNATLAQPRLPAGHKHLGFVRYETSLHDKAMDSLACALFLDPRDAQLRDLLVGEEGEAKTEARMGAAALNISDCLANPAYIGIRATILRSKARAAARQRRWLDAERLYRRLTRIRYNDPHVYIQLGHALNEQKKLDAAEIAFRQAVAVAPLFSETWLNLGYILSARKQHMMAREAFAMVNRLAPARRKEHPILESADALQSSAATDLPDTFLNRRLVRPNDLSPREESIWLRLATQIERKS